MAYEDLTSKIEQAKKVGYSDDEIVKYLANKDNRVKKAMSAGYKPNEIVNFLIGSQPKQTNSSAPQSVNNSEPSQANSSVPQSVNNSEPSQANNSVIGKDLISMIKDDGNTMQVNTGENIPNVTNSLDTKRTMTQPEIKQSQEAEKSNNNIIDTAKQLVNPVGAKAIVEELPKAIEQAPYTAKQEAAGAMSTFAGIYKTGLQYTNLGGIWDNAIKGADNSIRFWDSYSKELAKKNNMSQEGVFTPNNVGRMLPTLLAFGPESEAGVGAAVFLNGVFGQGQAAGEVEKNGELKSFKDAAISGLVDAALTKAGYMAIDWLHYTPTEKLLGEMKDKYNLSNEEINKKTLEYLQVMEPDNIGLIRKLKDGFDKTDTALNQAKVKAILYSTGKDGLNMGAKDLAQASELSGKAESNIIKDITNRKKVLNNIVKTKYNNVKEFSDAFTQVEKGIKEDYKKFQDTIGKSTINSKPLAKEAETIPIEGPEWEALPEYLKSDLLKIKQLGGKETIETNDLIEAYKATNKLLSKNGDGTKGYNLLKIKNMVEKELKNTLTKEEFNKFKQINADYSQLFKVKQSKLGQLVSKVDSGDMTVDDLLSKLPNLSEGPSTFKSIRYLVGSDKANKLENYIVDKILEKADDLNYKRLSTMLGKKGFQSPEAIQVQQLSDRLARSFKVDSVYNKAIADLEVREGAKTSMEDVAKALGVKAVANQLVKLFPTAKGAEARYFSRLTKVLKSPSNVRKIEDFIDNASIEGRKQVMNDVIKLLAHKPDAVTKTVDNTPNYVTPEGQVIRATENGTENKVSSVVLGEKQTKVLKDHILKNLPGKHPKDVDNAIKALNSYNYKQLAKDARLELDKVDANKWPQMYKTIVDNKTKDLANKIERDTGVKLPQSEVNKLVKREMDKDLVKIDEKGNIDAPKPIKEMMDKYLNSKRLKEEIPKLISKKYGKDFTYNDTVKMIDKEAENFAKRTGISKENAMKVILNKWKKECK
jgi:hypothetical protein